MEAMPEEGPPQQQAGEIQDTIPPQLKQHFFAGRSPPNLAADYDVLGFDADHCLVKYNIPKLTEFLARATNKDLVEILGYPEEIKQIPESLFTMSLNNCVWDIEHRTLLKLGENKLVVRAFKGSKRLSQE